MKYTAPSYVKKFKCAAKDCRDSCCIGWEIYADEITREKYKKMTGALSEDIRNSLTDEGCFRLRPDGRCPHLLEDGLCRLICECGEEALCEICREHPRFYNTYGDRTEWGIGLCCESAARIILSESDPLCFFSENRDGQAEETDGVLFSLLYGQRDRMMQLALDENLSFDEKAHALTEWAKKLQEHIDNADISKDLFTYRQEERQKDKFFGEERLSEYKALLLSLEPLSDGWPKRCERLPESLKGSESCALYARLLAYYIYRYFLPSGMEGDVTAPIGLALCLTAVTSLLCESEGRRTLNDIAEAAKDLAKEIECSEENRDAVLDAFSAFAF